MKLLKKYQTSEQKRKINLIRKFEKIMTAVAFAEANEHETARKIMEEDLLEERKQERIQKRYYVYPSVFARYYAEVL